MPWCPKCKSEYRPGFETCADCGCQLVEEEPVEEKTASGDSWASSAPDGFMGRILREEILTEEEQEDIKRTAQAGNRKSSKVTSYKDNEERANENRSSAMILILLGGLGLVAVALGLAGFLPINVGNSALFYGVMGALFLLFFLSGFVSIKSAKQYRQKAESENSVRNTIIEWSKENLTAEMVDQGMQITDDDADEVKYLKRCAGLHYLLDKQFLNLENGFLDNLIEETLYDLLFHD